MAVRAKLTVKRGQRAQHVVVSAGTEISGSDAIEVNIDVTNASKADVLIMLDTIKQQIHEHGFPQAGA